LLCEGLKVVLSMAAEKNDTVSLPSFEEGLCAARGGGFDLILADTSLAPNGAREAARALKVASPNSRIIMLASNIAKSELLESLAVGAHGFVLKDASLEESALAIRDVVSGRIYVPNEIHLPPPSLMRHSFSPARRSIHA
jgi:DNA-binding NarL/FixJ family response regulator